MSPSDNSGPSCTGAPDPAAQGAGTSDAGTHGFCSSCFCPSDAGASGVGTPGTGSARQGRTELSVIIAASSTRAERCIRASTLHTTDTPCHLSNTRMHFETLQPQAPLTPKLVPPFLGQKADD